MRSRQEMKKLSLSFQKQYKTEEPKEAFFFSSQKNTSTENPSHTRQCKIAVDFVSVQSHDPIISKSQGQKRPALLDSLPLLEHWLFLRCWLAVTLCLSTSNPKSPQVGSPWQLRHYLPLGWDYKTWHLKLEAEKEAECTRQQERVTQGTDWEYKSCEFKGKRGEY